MFNLFDNAAKYAPKGFRIMVTRRPEGKSIVIRVLDEGEGIPEADLERIFEEVLSRSAIRPAACRHRARARHLPRFRRIDGSSITAANRVDRPGAVFTIKLPTPVTPRLPAEVLP